EDAGFPRLRLACDGERPSADRGRAGLLRGEERNRSGMKKSSSTVIRSLGGPVSDRKGRAMADNGTGGFSDAERAAIKERAAELRAEKGGKKAAAGLEDLLTSIAAMPDDQRVIAERIHAIVTRVAPALTAKTWYGQP